MKNINAKPYLRNKSICPHILMFLISILLIENILDSAPTIRSEDSSFTIIKKADQYEELGRFDDALMLLESINIKMVPNKEKLEISLRKGRLNWTLGIPAKALDYFKLSKTIANTANNQDYNVLIDKSLNIISLYSAAKILRTNNDPAGAIIKFREAIDLSRSIKRNEFEMKCFRQMSLAYLDMNKLSEFLSCNERALAIAREKHHKRDEGYCLNNIGIYYHKTNSYSKALSFYELSLKIAQTEKNSKAESECFTNMGNVNLLLGETDQAVALFEKSLTLDQQSNDLEYKSIDLINLSIAHRRKWLESKNDEDLKNAFSFLNKSYELIRREDSENIKLRIINNLGIISFNLKEYDKALKYFSEGINRAERIQDREAICHYANNIGTIHARFGKEDQAIEYFRKAIALAAEIDAGQVLWEAFFELAEIQKRKGAYDEALASYQYAMAVIEKGRSSIDSEDLKTSFLGSDRRLDVYHGAIDLLYRMNRADGSKPAGEIAFQFIERAKARSFLDSLEIGRISAAGSRDPEIEAKLHTIGAGMAKLSRRYLTPPATTEERKVRDEEAARLEDEYDRLRRDVRIRDPKYAGVRFPEILTLAKLKRTLLDRNTIIITYAVGRRTAYALAIDRHGERFYPIPGPEELKALVSLHLKAASDREAAVSHSGEALFDKLIRPGWNREYRRIIVVPDDVLHYLPFETLRPAEGSGWLGARAEISYAPSLSSLAEIEKRADRRSAPARDVLAIASPDRDSTTASASFPFREREVEDIARLFPSNRCEVLKSNGAREAAVKAKRFEDFRIIHFASHGIIDEIKPVRSAIVLPADPDSDEDGYFQAREIFDLRLNAGLVTLSSCRSAAGRLVRGEGIEGLNRSFLFAGASAVLMSLWPVDDEATSHLMLRFYRYLGDGNTVAGALRQAKIEMIGSRTFSHPYFWAGFIVTGAADRPLAQGFRVKGILAPAGASLVVIISLGIFFRRKIGNRASKSSGRSPRQ